MSASGIKARDVLDELESHLREDIEQHMRSGATAEQAFHDAVQRVGAGDKLNQEFGKISVPQPRFSRRAMRGWCLAAAAFVFATETWTLIAYDVRPVERFLGIALVSAFACYIGALPDLNRMLVPGVRGWALRRAVAKGCSYAAMLWVGLLFVGLVYPALLPSGIIFGVVCWALVAAACMTALIIACDTDTYMLDLWSPAASRCFELASAEAARFHHDFVGTEHVLLGLLGEENGAARKLLQNMGVQGETVCAEIEKIVGSGPQLHEESLARFTHHERSKRSRLQSRKPKPRERFESKPSTSFWACCGRAAVSRRKSWRDWE